MKRLLCCNITVMDDDAHRCIFLNFKKQFVERFLIMLDALELGRLGVLLLCDCDSCDNCVEVSYTESGLSLELLTPNMQLMLSHEQLQLIKCVCIDSIFENYDSPHVDFECGDCDLTISF